MKEIKWVKNILLIPTGEIIEMHPHIEKQEIKYRVYKDKNIFLLNKNTLLIPTEDGLLSYRNNK